MAKEQRKPTVYVETSIFRVLVAWPSANVVIAGRQETTRRWWREDREKFALMTSELVEYEAGLGDAEMARRRVEHIDSCLRCR